MILLLLMLVCCGTPEKESLVKKESPNVQPKKTPPQTSNKTPPSIDKNSIDFISSVQSIRSMNKRRCVFLRESKSSHAVLEFCERQMEEDAKMNAAITVLITEANASIPTVIDFQHNEELQATATPKSNTEKYILERWLFDIDRELAEFQNATELRDTPVRHFAIKYLPMVQKQQTELLELLEGLK